MLLLDFQTVILSLALSYGFLLAVGLLIGDLLLGPKFLSYPFFVRMPLYAGLGLAVLILIFLAIGTFSVNILTPLATLAGTLAYLACRRARRKGPRQIRPSMRNLVVDNLLPSILFFITVLYYAFIVVTMGWPTIGDTMATHGPLVALIQHNGRLPTTPNPILIAYPPGLHVMTATLNGLMGLYPAQAVFLLAASIAILISSAIYSLTYMATRSKRLSLVAFLSVFLIHPCYIYGPPQVDPQWIGAFFLNGTFPPLAGYLIFFVFMASLACYPSDFYRSDWTTIKKYLLLSLLVTAALIVTYPPFALFVISHVIITSIVFRGLLYRQCRLIAERFLRSNAIRLVAFLALVAVVLYGLFLMSSSLFPLIVRFLSGNIVSLKETITPEVSQLLYYLRPSFFLDHLSGVLAILAIPSSAYLILKRRFNAVASLYLLVMAPLLLSLNPRIYPFIQQLILPMRSAIIASTLSWPLCIVALHRILESHPRLRLVFRRGSGHFFSSNHLTLVAILVLFLLLLNPYYYPDISLQNSTSWAWFTREAYFPDGFAALQWIDKNVPPDAIILNDLSHTGRYASSLSIKNLVWQGWTQFEDADQDLRKIWKNPKDVELSKQMLRKYNIRYILSTSEPGFLSDSWSSMGYGYFEKPYLPEEYARIFDSYSFLKVVFKSGATRVYEVVQEALDV